MLIADPCLVESIRRQSGPKRLLVYVANGDPTAVEASIANVSKPEWIDIEGGMIGDVFKVKKGGRLPLVVNINTDHRFFPEAGPTKEEVRFTFADGRELAVYVYLQEIIASVGAFRGTLAIDFGTTNTCYAWKDRVSDTMQMSDALKHPSVSAEIPTIIRFQDIANKDAPGVEIGNKARLFVAENAGRSYQYVISVKRLLGQNRQFTILDDRSGQEPDRLRRYTPEEIASFFLRDLLKEAEGRIGGKIEQVVATFPILWNKRAQDALRKAFALAFKHLGRENWNPDNLVLRLDETNAAAFNYIYGHMMDEFRRFSVTSRKHRLLSYDFGGGTVDVSLVDIDLDRDTAGRVTINTTSVGITGDRHLGGDMVTLAVLRLLKLKIVKAVAEHRSTAAERAAAEKAAKAKSQDTANNPWSFSVGAPAAPAAAAGDPWASLGGNDAANEAAAAAEEPEEDPLTADIECMVPESKLDKAWKAVVREKDAIDYACTHGISPADALNHLAANGVISATAFELRERSKELVEAIDLILPTAWKTLEENGDLIAKETARKLFYELWLPAEAVKIRAVSDASRQTSLTEPLRRIAKYTGVRPEDLMGVTVAESEINALIEPMIRRSIGKAAALVELAGGSGQPAPSSSGIDFGSLLGGSASTTSTERPLTVLLAGNGSRLPLVRQVMAEALSLDPSMVVMDPNGLKATVAQGACEEHILRRDFGESGGLIQYRAGDFTNRIPYAVGLFHKELSLLGYPGGFVTVLPRGTDAGRTNPDGSQGHFQVLLSEATQVVHRTTTELPVFAWFHDHKLGLDASAAGALAGVQPTSLGWFDLTAPEREPYAQPFAPEVQAQIDAAGGLFTLVMAIDHNRDLHLVRPDTRAWFKLKTASDAIPDADYPFSGVH